jgi:tripartite-type tricarboxylate transporter receptor subunit TctC
MNARAGITIVHVPYRGIADATKDLLGGQLQAMTASIPATLPQLAAGKVKVLAVTGAKRIPQLPDVPSWQEQGVPDAEVINYWGIVAPTGTPRDVVARVNAETQKVLAQPDVRERLEREGAELIPGPPERLAGLIEGDLARWKKLIAEAKLSFD